MPKPTYPHRIETDGMIIGLKKYAHGFTGCIETADHYEFFLFARGKYKVIQQYVKKDFTERKHFIDVLRKFVHAGFFGRPPVAVSRISSEVLEEVYRG